MSNNELGKSETKPLKTFLISYGVATVGEHTRENFHLGLVEAPNLNAATECAWQVHCPEGLEEEDDGRRNGRWIEYDGHRAFQLSGEAPDVDANCIYWLDNITDLPVADVPVLSNYLSVFRPKTPAELSSTRDQEQTNTAVQMNRK